VYGQPLGREAVAQLRHDVAIDLDRVQMPYAFGERLRQRAQPRPDLHHRIIGLRPDRVEDTRDVYPIDQEVLAEAFARAMSGAARRRSH